MRTRIFFASILPLFAQSGCGGDPSSPASPVTKLTSITITPPAVSLDIGQTKVLTATAFDQFNAQIQGQSFAWTSANSGIVSVNQSGSVTGVTSGTTTVSAAIGSVSATASITVAQVPVSAVIISPSSFSLTIGQTQKATATIRDAAGNQLTGRTISWRISDGNIASVSNDGTVSALSSGSTTLIASSEGVDGSAAVTVTAPTNVVTLDYAADLGLGGVARTLSTTVTATVGSATINGADSRGPSIPFTFRWGDGSTSTGFFPQTHTYSDAARNYMARVIAHYSASSIDSVDVVVRFTAPIYTPVPFNTAATVTIPQDVPSLINRLNGSALTSSLRAVPESQFAAALPRTTLEYVLSQASSLELGILENDVEKVNGEWRQVVLNDPSFGGGYSLWFTSPIALAAGSTWFGVSPAYSSAFHEMGHNLSLNAPAAFRFGGRIDGNANAIFSESVAQLFQHTVAFELVNNSSRYGLSQDLALDIASSAHSSAQVIQRAYDSYLAQGKPFNTWNDPATSIDETTGSFMTVARQFLVHAEQAKSYVLPLTRTMRLLRTFNQTMASQYAPGENSAAANTFRSTLMVAALSYGFQQDLRSEFRALNFPIDDAVYASLYGSVP